MSVLFETFQANAKFKKETVCSAWHQEFPLLAVSTGNGVVSIYSDEGERVEDANLSRSSNCTALAWNPLRSALVTGWRDGVIIVYDNTDHSTKEVSQTPHSTEITTLQWNHDGTRLVSSDKSGIVAVWRFDNPKQNMAIPAGARLVCEAKYNVQEHISFVIFKKTLLYKDDDSSEVSADSRSTAVLANSWVFFFGGKTGIVYIADDVGHCEKAFNVGAPIAALLFQEDKSRIVTLTQTSVLTIYGVSNDLRLSQMLKTKIVSSSSQQSAQATLKGFWVGKGLLATTCGERVLRIWNLETDDHYILDSNKIQDVLVSCAFNPKKRVLACATDSSIYFFKYQGSSDEVQKLGDWDDYGEYKAPEKISSICWGPGDELISVHTPDYVYILHETILKKKMRGKLVLVQLSADSLILENLSLAQPKVLPIKCRTKIKNVDLSKDNIIASSGKVIELYECKEAGIVYKNTFEVPSHCIALHTDGFFAAYGNKVEIYSLNGSRKQTLQFTEQEGIPYLIDIEGDMVAIATRNNVIKVWQITGREAKQVGVAKQIFPSPVKEDEKTDKIASPKALEEQDEEKEARLEIAAIKCNCDGSKISILSRYVQNVVLHEPSTHIHVFDVYQDKVDSYDFKTTGRYPTSHFWDETEPKLLGVEAIRYSGSEEGDEKENAGRIEVCTLFATLDHGILLQDAFPLDRKLAGLVGLSIPYLFFNIKDVSVSASTTTEKKPLRDFEGINIKDNETRDALLNFSYFLTIGNMEEAFKSVKMIKDGSVWQNMAQMCVKTKKMDVAEICLGNMEDARAARALREAKAEPELEARIAVLAIHLGLLKEAERLYKVCKRYDLLNRMYQSVGKWAKAIDIAEKHDRIHLKATHYRYARYLESIGDMKEACKHYELSKTHQYEIPRMLYEAQAIPQLEQYVQMNQTPENAELLKWWAQYCEGTGNLEEAYHYYTVAQDNLSLVRMFCFDGNLKKAAEIAKSTKDKASCFHLAKQLESTGHAKEAIQFYTIAHAYKHAIRLAREKDMEQHVLNLSLLSTPDVMLEAAQYFDEKGMRDKAVVLYQKSGNTAHAIDLCFREQLFDALLQIADGLGADADPQILMKCAEFFVQHEKFDKAVQLYVNAGQYDHALELCHLKGVPLTEELADLIAPPNKSESKEGKETEREKNDEKSEEKAAVAIKVAKIAAAQGAYQLATKKYIQAGNKHKAMKVLIKFGDTERVIYFALYCRQKELYVMAANYLQNLDWHNEPEIMRSIIMFYTKARAWESLSNFYEACSQVEIDEYRNYDKALDALKEALKYLTKANVQDKEKIIGLKNRIYLVDKFLTARGLAKKDPNEMVKLCNQLLNESVVEEAIRVGDVYALLVEHFFSQGNKEQAFQVIQKMKERNIILNYYLDPRMVSDIYQAVGAEAPAGAGNLNQSHDEEEIYEEIEEEIVEDH